MSGTEALAHAERAAALLARDPRVVLVYVFGSAAAPERPHARDVDLAVLTTPALSLDELMRLRADIEQWRLAGQRLAESQRGSWIGGGSRAPGDFSDFTGAIRDWLASIAP